MSKCSAVHQIAESCPLLFCSNFHCLQCLSCIDVSNVNDCRKKTCTSDQSTCFKGVLTLPFGSKEKSYILDCATSCEDYKNLFSNVEQAGINMEISCCSTDLCNGVDGVRGNLWVLAVMLLLSLGPALLWAGL
ncbi:lymphocyte antigen 6H-like [Notamacropus eugenii]|uniref:lymphocyte antigen 6H-like n=1 Tax=Notamacropus eugenii TaxID=9315 RepID=UPI003B67A25F